VDEAVPILQGAVERGEQSADAVADLVFANGVNEGIQKQNWSHAIRVLRLAKEFQVTDLTRQKLDFWLGDGKWDVVHFNFGIHDRNTPIGEYSQRLEQLVERMKKTGAKLIWATTTPIPDDPAKKQTAASIVERNQAAAQIMQEHGVATDDLFAAVTPHLETMQNPNDVHFNAAGYEFLGQQVGKAIEDVLQQ